ncbi:ABC transporter permease [Moraxella oblonga]|uniref:ABC transporter permease n=1 Tax=Moraxella oblonga TaxID=200413 RepID=UPI0008342E0E|nr:iron ABC transporter permease [Moraxella oblonga]
MGNLTVLLSRLWVVLCAFLVVVPVLVIVSALGKFDQEIWDYLLDYQLPLLVKNTIILAIGVAVGVLFLGTTTAWLLAMYRFPLSKTLSWAMMLPLAVPAYVLAFVQLGLFEYSAPISTYLRETYGFEQGLPDIRNGVGLTIVMSLAFYPYVYLLAKNAFGSMGSRALEVGASLGLSPVQSFIKIALPMARPWIAGGLMLALMEVLADFGAVSIFGYDTFTTAIYESWFGFFSIETAKQLASLLILAVFVMVALEEWTRRGRRFEEAGRGNHYTPKTLTGIGKYLAMGWCLLVLGLAFFVPVIQLIIWIVQTWQGIDWQETAMQAYHSVSVAIVASVVVTLFALLIALAQRQDGGRFTFFTTKLALMGYAIPGTVLAVGVFVPVAYVDNVLIEWLNLGEETTAIFKGTLGVMIVAYLIRFLALGSSSVSAGMERVKPSLIEASHSLGVSGLPVIWRVYLPMLKGAMGVSLLMVFVDVMKEMPITLMMRPSDWDMLAVRIHAFTMEGIYDRASLPALLIVVVGLVPVIWFSRLGQNDK